MPHLVSMENQPGLNLRGRLLKDENLSSSPISRSSSRLLLGQDHVSSADTSNTRFLSSDDLNEPSRHVFPSGHANTHRTRSNTRRRTTNKPVFTAKQSEWYTRNIKIMVSRNHAATSNILKRRICQAEMEVMKISEVLGVLIQNEICRVKRSAPSRANPVGQLPATVPQGTENGLDQRYASTIPSEQEVPNVSNMPSCDALLVIRSKGQSIRKMLRIITRPLQQGVVYNDTNFPCLSVLEPTAVGRDDRTTVVLYHLMELKEEKERWKTMQFTIQRTKAIMGQLRGQLHSLTRVWKCQALESEDALNT